VFITLLRFVTSHLWQELDCLEVANFGNLWQHKVTNFGNFLQPKVTNSGNFWQHKITKVGNFIVTFEQPQNGAQKFPNLAKTHFLL